jgi:NADH-quinone oxidoreductase subunit C
MTEPANEKAPLDPEASATSRAAETVAPVVARFPGVVTARPSVPAPSEAPGGGTLSLPSARGEAVVTVDAAHWGEVARWLKAEGGFGFLSDLCGADWPHRQPRFDVVVTLTDMDTPRRLRIVVGVPDGSPPAAPSVTGIWPGANWFERETYDLFGIVFEGHPDLTRILMPDEWEGYPLRKDYSVGKVPVEYKHLSPGH